MKKLLLLLTLAAMVVSCSEDNMETETDLINQQNISLDAKAQKPLAALDNDVLGLYHGVYVSGTTTQRGKIWINLGNNGDYSATVEMVDGETIRFKGMSVSDLEYHFEANNAQFEAVLDNGELKIEEASLDNELFFGSVLKEESSRSALALTGTFISDNGNISGTWNLLADGSLPDPNIDYGSGIESSGITKAMITSDGVSFEDDVFETFSLPCGLVNDWVPAIVNLDEGVSPDAVVASAQYSFGQIGNITAETTWSVTTLFDGGNSYVDDNCETASSGTFTSITSRGTLRGSIFLDL